MQLLIEISMLKQTYSTSVKGPDNGKDVKSIPLPRCPRSGLSFTRLFWSIFDRVLSLAVVVPTAELYRKIDSVITEHYSWRLPLFIGAPSSLYPNDVCAVLGNFLPKIPTYFLWPTLRFTLPGFLCRPFVCVHPGVLFFIMSGISHFSVGVP